MLTVVNALLHGHGDLDLIEARNALDNICVDQSGVNSSLVQVVVDRAQLTALQCSTVWTGHTQELSVSRSELQCQHVNVHASCRVDVKLRSEPRQYVRHGTF